MTRADAFDLIAQGFAALAQAERATAQNVGIPAQVPTDRAEWLDAAEVAAELGMSAVFVREQCRAGLLPAQRLGNRWRIQRRDLDRYLERSRRRIRRAA